MSQHSAPAISYNVKGSASVARSVNLRPAYRYLTTGHQLSHALRSRDYLPLLRLQVKSPSYEQWITAHSLTIEPFDPSAWENAWRMRVHTSLI